MPCGPASDVPGPAARRIHAPALDPAPPASAGGRGASAADDPATADRQASVEMERDGAAVDPVLLDEDARRQRVRRVVVAHLDRPLENDWPGVEILIHVVDGAAADAHAV